MVLFGRGNKVGWFRVQHQGLRKLLGSLVDQSFVFSDLVQSIYIITNNLSSQGDKEVDFRGMLHESEGLFIITNHELESIVL